LYLLREIDFGAVAKFVGGHLLAEAHIIFVLQNPKLIYCIKKHVIKYIQVASTFKLLS